MSASNPGRSSRGTDSPSVSTGLLDTQSPVSTPGFSPPVAAFARISRSGSVHSLYSDSPYGGNRQSAIIDKYSLGPDPRLWGADLSLDYREDDDELHRPEGASGGKVERDGGVISLRGIANLGCVFILILGMLALFAGYPIISHFTRKHQSTNGAFNVGGTNATGQVPDMPGGFSLIDKDTPKSAFSMPSWNGREEMELVFSDEFNTDGRTFYPGDDPYWEAVDLHYWQTVNWEWYDPSSITTAGGNLVITLKREDNHKLKYMGGMLQSWNKFCFTGGYIEASVMLPGLNNVHGLWPAIWTMGNLGRAGYGASTHGLWPYSYDACDAGTVRNQSIPGVGPDIPKEDGDKYTDGFFSFQQGQRLSACTCDSDSDLHPGPKRKGDSKRNFVGRSAPEIDIFEAQVSQYEDPDTGLKHQYGEVSQSAQWAPFNPKYLYDNGTGNVVVNDWTISRPNSYSGGVYQQASSIITKTNQLCYEHTAQCYSVYGFEYKPGFDDAYITWVSDGKSAWTINAAAMGPNEQAMVSARPIPEEPLYIILNLGMSDSFGAVEEDKIPFPVHMYVDYVRVYQPKGKTNVGCDPEAFPTSKYISKYADAYSNPNLTTWDVGKTGYNQTWPRNSLIDQC